MNTALNSWEQQVRQIPSVFWKQGWSHMVTSSPEGAVVKTSIDHSAQGGPAIIDQSTDDHPSNSSLLLADSAGNDFIYVSDDCEPPLPTNPCFERRKN